MHASSSQQTSKALQDECGGTAFCQRDHSLARCTDSEFCLPRKTTATSFTDLADQGAAFRYRNKQKRAGAKAEHGNHCSKSLGGDRRSCPGRSRCTLTAIWKNVADTQTDIPRHRRVSHSHMEITGDGKRRYACRQRGRYLTEGEKKKVVCKFHPSIFFTVLYCNTAFRQRCLPRHIICFVRCNLQSHHRWETVFNERKHERCGNFRRRGNGWWGGEGVGGGGHREARFCHFLSKIYLPVLWRVNLGTKAE